MRRSLQSPTADLHFKDHPPKLEQVDQCFIATTCKMNANERERTMWEKLPRRLWPLQKPLDDAYEMLESRHGWRYLHRRAQDRHRQTEDIEMFFGMSDENGHLLMDRKEVLTRGRHYFEGIPTVEIPHPSRAPIHGPTHKIIV